MLSTPSCGSVSSISRDRSNGPHLLHRRADRMPIDAEDIPEYRRKRRVAVAGEADLFRPFDELRRRRAFGGDAGKIALDVGGKNRNARRRKALGQHLQRHRLAGARRPRDEAVPVGERELDALGRQIPVRLADTDKDQAVLNIVARIGDGFALLPGAMLFSHLATSSLAKADSPHPALR